MKDNQAYEEFIKGIWRDNPVFVQVLGMCPMLAVTNSAINAVAMGGATFFVLVGSSILVSTFRNLIPKQVRISCFIIIIATFVTMVDYAIQAISLDLYNALGAFIQLIVVNCMILGRAEAYASKQPLGPTLVNGLGMGAGFTIALKLRCRQLQPRHANLKAVRGISRSIKAVRLLDTDAVTRFAAPCCQGTTQRAAGIHAPVAVYEDVIQVDAGTVFAIICSGSKGFIR